MTKNGNLYVISGPSGVGKYTVIKEFLKTNNDIQLSISCTTRTPRKGEVDGIDYFFISKEEFNQNIQNSNFLEWAEFNGNFYGTKRDYVDKTLAKGKNLILEIDTVGALQVKKQISSTVLIFIAPPDIDTLRKRLYGRGTESGEIAEKRLQIALTELQKTNFFDFVVVNDKVEDAVVKLTKIICK